MRTLQYLFDKEYNQMEKVDVSQIPDEITVEYLAEITKQMRHARADISLPGVKTY